MGTDSGPDKNSKVGEVRTTIGEFEDGESFKIVDYWQTCEKPHQNLGRFWTGTTTFTTITTPDPPTNTTQRQHHKANTNTKPAAHQHCSATAVRGGMRKEDGFVIRSGR